MKIRANDTGSLEAFLMEGQMSDGVLSVRNYIALSTFVERRSLPDL